MVGGGAPMVSAAAAAESAAAPMVSIVGAGPGAMDLLTMRALRRLQEAEVVLYDNLVSEEILSCCAKGVLLEYVGKRYGDRVDPMVRQQRINERLALHARAGRKVVRLKSGDPFIYGRAIEELRYLEAQGILCEVVPGITAGIAAAAACHIPLTERNSSNAVLFCTGHTADHDLDQLDTLAAMLYGGTTLVLYMGLSNLEVFVKKLRAVMGGMPVRVSAVSKVSQPGQRVVRAGLDRICEELAEARLEMPVVFIIQWETNE